MNNRKDLSPRLAAIQDRLGTATGKHYWRSLEELADSEAFRELMRGEFPQQSDVWPNSLSRRKFLGLMGASLALAGLGGCSVRPAASTDIVPYAHPPEEVVPGRPLFFATTMTHAGTGVGLLVESHEGRPTKIEGNPDHPASRGATNAFHQASVLQLYDPDRAKTVTHLGQTRTWDDFGAAVREPLKKIRDSRGAGLRLLTESIISPTLADQINALLKEMPEAKWHVWEPVNRDAARAAQQMAFGEMVDPIHDFTKADVVLSLDADFLQCGHGHLAYAADFIARRRLRGGEDEAAQAQMNRLYVVETAVSCTGAKADHRLALRPSEIDPLARAIAARLGVATSAGAAEGGENEKWIAAVAKDLSAHRGRSLVLAGDGQPPAIHLLAHAINDHLGNVGQTVRYIAPIEARPEERAKSLADLLNDIDRKQVDMLVILGGNPAYSAPADLNFAARMANAPVRIHHGLYIDETSYRCQWHLPATHYLESWSDARSHDGTVSLVQPLIAPLYEGRSTHEVVAILAGALGTPGREIVRKYWRGQYKKPDFERYWRTALHNGLIADTQSQAKTIKLTADWEKNLAKARTSTASSGKPASRAPAVAAASGPLEIVFLADPTIYDGDFANNGWLQELPKPLTKLAWGNAAIMSPATARQHGLKMGDYAHGGEHGGYYMPVVELVLGERSVEAPVWIMPGHADGTVTVFLGHGRTQAGRVGGSPEQTIGFNAYLLRTSQQLWSAGKLALQLMNKTELVACTQAHQTMEDREPIRAGTLAQYREHPQFATDQDREKLREQGQSAADAEKVTLYPNFDYSPPKHRWGMSIDLTSCIGCHACVVACQAENNIPVVGKEQVARGREMHWLRVDRYISGTADKPEEFHFQPLPCQQCENAPCEYVCPVAATVHSAEGLNDMNYQRCVGTRFCSNNCPYKVRHFNFLAFADFDTPSRRLQYNPEVTVRSRGVMEKCTYCVQRIRRAEIDAQTQGNRPIADGEVLTACQAACPTQAIVFGDINDPESQVKQNKDLPLNYSLLADTNTRPRTTYLAEVRNPNPELEGT